MRRSPDYFTQQAAIVEPCCKILGAGFYCTPDSESVQHCLPLLQTALVERWPYGDASALQAIQNQLQSSDNLNFTYQQLFIGPNPLSAPPWGSVYLDHESVVFGESTVVWRHFLAEHQLALQSAIQNEPEDHFGLMLWALAMLVARHEPEACCELLEKHLLPWSTHYLALLENSTDGFYAGLARLTAITLSQWVKEAGLRPVSATLYFPPE